MINKLLSRLFWPAPYIETDKSLQDKVIMIFGASSGLGQATVELLGKKGATVISIDRESNKKRLKFDGSNYQYLTADTADLISVQRAVDKAIETNGKIDVVVNCFGIFGDKSISDTSNEEFAMMLTVNVGGVFNSAKAIVPQMIKQKSGTIINIGSKISHNSNVAPNKVSYATTKYAVEGFSFALNKELKPFGIRVCCLMPGTIATFFSRLGKNYLSPHEVADIIKYIIESPNLDIESMVFKSVHQNI